MGTPHPLGTHRLVGGGQVWPQPWREFHQSPALGPGSGRRQGLLSGREGGRGYADRRRDRGWSGEGMGRAGAIFLMKLRI